MSDRIQRPLSADIADRFTTESQKRAAELIGDEQMAKTSWQRFTGPAGTTLSDATLTGAVRSDVDTGAAGHIARMQERAAIVHYLRDRCAMAVAGVYADVIEAGGHYQ